MNVSESNVEDLNNRNLNVDSSTTFSTSMSTPNGISSPHSGSGDVDDEWDINSRNILLESIGKFLPLGINKYFSLLNCTVLLQSQLPNKSFSTTQVFNEIKEFYNLDELDDDIIDDESVENFDLPEEYKDLIEEKKLNKKLKL
ncbi:hypothetical protein DLAC_11462 [Tieghemostelium lacteum]|uniref:Uncharacterized protein n=1 Tax=Tieghemostelium lacteum TaxID=361077 RepID=A0A152A7T0_TIELA|nr:hypothetical protein DLAC_11462 [Tieghemostelium lacteum]|eukprot:KYR02292.1 hypothetical protein DLAC_11462 [Tieghemostelium lacteum]